MGNDRWIINRGRSDKQMVRFPDTGESRGAGSGYTPTSKSNQDDASPGAAPVHPQDS